MSPINQQPKSSESKFSKNELKLVQSILQSLKNTFFQTLVGSWYDPLKNQQNKFLHRTKQFLKFNEI